MYTNEATEGNADRAISVLANESRVPVDVVAQLYQAERVKLHAGARITGYISILAIRNVRRLLRRTDDRSPTVATAADTHRVPE